MLIYSLEQPSSEISQLLSCISRKWQLSWCAKKTQSKCSFFFQCWTSQIVNWKKSSYSAARSPCRCSRGLSSKLPNDLLKELSSYIQDCGEACYSYLDIYIVSCMSQTITAQLCEVNLPWLVVVCGVWSVTFTLCNSILVLKMDLCILIFASPSRVGNEGLTVTSLTELFLRVTEELAMLFLCFVWLKRNWS